jgi:hypothetical protein
VCSDSLKTPPSLISEVGTLQIKASLGRTAFVRVTLTTGFLTGERKHDGKTLSWNSKVVLFCNAPVI